MNGLKAMDFVISNFSSFNVNSQCLLALTYLRFTIAKAK